MGTGYWCIGDGVWNHQLALDEFGPGTLDGIPAHGGSNDGCGPAAIVNGTCAYEGRTLTYAEIGEIRADMILSGRWTQPASVGNPRTGGCTMGNIHDEIPVRKYAVIDWIDEQGSTLAAAQIHEALTHSRYVIVMVFNAQALQGNEPGVQRHFVGIAAYGGDAGSGNSGGVDGHGWGKVYILNSDIGGQHGTATGQWMWIDDLMKADPRGFVVVDQPPAPTPPPPPAKQYRVSVNGTQVAAVPSLSALEVIYG